MMSELKVNYGNDNEFKCIRRIACKLGLAMPESDDEILNLSQYRRVERAIDSMFESNNNLVGIATKHATRADELYEALEMCTEALERSYDATEWPADGSSQQEVTAVQCREVLDRTKIEKETKQ